MGGTKYLFSKWKDDYREECLTHSNRMDNNRLSEPAIHYKPEGYKDI
jgi:hypothetical protein